MTIDISTEAWQTAEALVASGRFQSIQEVIQAGVTTLATETNEPQWSSDLQAAVDAGVEATRKNDFADDSELDALFSRYHQPA